MAEEWDVFQMLPGDDAPVLLATLYEAREKTIRPELNGPASASFAINRSSPECTEAILAQGNLVRVRIPEIHTDYIFAFFLETGDFTLISSQEEGGEMLTFGGRGILSYLDYAQAWSESYIDGGDDPEAGVWRAYNAGTGAAPGQILRRLIEEFQHPDRGVSDFGLAGSHPIPLLTIDFDYDVDSNGDPWDETDATDEFSYQVGERGMAILQRLLDTETIRVQMDPDFTLHAYNVDNLGRDLTGLTFGAGVVRFQRGINIATELRRTLEAGQSSLGGGGGVPETHMLAQGEADKYGTAALGDAATRVTREGFIAAFGTGTTALNGIAAAELRTRLITSDTIMFQIANRRTADVVLSDPVSVGATVGPDAEQGSYLPGPEGTNGDFWLGDTVRVHTGLGPFDYVEVDAVVQAITISRDDDNAELIVIPEMKTQPFVCPDATEAGYFPPRLALAQGGSFCGDDNIYLYGRAGGSCNGWHFLGYNENWAGNGLPHGDFVDNAVAGVSNSIFFTIVGDGTLSIHCYRAIDATDTTRVAISDNGVLSQTSNPSPKGGAAITYELTGADEGTCVHLIRLDLNTVGGGPTRNIIFQGVDWTPAV